MVNRFLTLATTAAAAAFLHVEAAAQLMPAALPNHDFRWQWGDVDERHDSTFRSFSSRGHEAGFTCMLTGSLRPGTQADPTDLRRLESELGISLYFIQSAARTMNDLDYRRQLAWAVLDCTLPEERERDADAQEERLDRLRERALRRQQQRREQRARQEAREEARRN